MKRNKQKVTDIHDRQKKFNIQIIGTTKEENKIKGTEQTLQTMFKKIY